ncbi:MAG TPA: type IV toxin-antitoxin system AbiEi family antitoxin domain-containing protein [Candidatus Fimihabitans intestinipullorum]|uniref:Type IV toxin-antitoxin system AbiEi family antitoxin domain-containing protein n=1 Tax=Candidatus Fimihabitans intestinipullorum TaxID=2840820 RepID=A0A9D1HUS3_9BACT|nr:type IV toxin-antitoxin system AbiEi family antitoxin domain-containing protein [Candidatus Fimihabitans intestinipullorum]
MEYENRILNLFKNGYLTTKEVTDNNIPRTYLTKLIEKNKIERVSRGIYIKKNVLVDEFVVLQSKSKYAIYSNTTALYLHGLSNRIPIRYDITIKSGYKGSLQKEKNVNLFYTKRELLELGVINYKLDSGNIIRVYDLDKTICDIIKNKKKIDAEIFNKAIKEYFYSKKKNTLKLYEYAKKMNIYNKVRDTFEVFG